MGTGLGSDIQSAQHSRQFFHPVLVAEPTDAGIGLPTLDLFAHLQLLRRLCGDLGEMGDAQYLGTFTDTSQLATDNFGDTAADTCVHFVKYESRRTG